MSRMSAEEQIRERNQRLQRRRMFNDDSNSNTNAMDTDSQSQPQPQPQPSSDNRQTESERQIEALQQRIIDHSSRLTTIRSNRNDLQKRLESMNAEIATMEREVNHDQRQLNSLLTTQEQSTSIQHSNIADADEELARSLWAEENRRAEREEEMMREAENENRRRQRHAARPQNQFEQIQRMYGGSQDARNSPFSQIRIVSNNNGIRTVHSSGGGGGGGPDSFMNNPHFMGMPPMIFGGGDGGMDGFNHQFFAGMGGMPMGIGGMPLGMAMQNPNRHAASRSDIENSTISDTFRAKPPTNNASSAVSNTETSSERQKRDRQRSEKEEKEATMSDGETETDETPERRCCICLEQFKDGDAIRRLPCLHFFHTDEIDKWLRTSNKCPVCRTPIDANAPPHS